MESTNILQKEDDEKISMEEEVCEKKKIWPKLSLGMFWNLSMMIVTIKIKTQLPFIKLHTFFVREFETMKTLLIMSYC
jgi:hypothetical protein